MPAAKIEGVRISKNVIKDADDGPVRFGESVICTNHWDKFKALMAGLNDKTYFRRILSIRMRDTQGMEGQEVANMMELKQYYELDDNRSVEVQDTAMNDIFSALKNEATH